MQPNENMLSCFRKDDIKILSLHDQIIKFEHST